jgi:hypothetical protein
MIVGNLTRDPDLRATTAGVPVINFRIASNRRFKDNSGEWKEDVCYVGVVAWQNPARPGSRREAPCISRASFVRGLSTTATARSGTCWRSGHIISNSSTGTINLRRIAAVPNMTNPMKTIAVE